MSTTWVRRVLVGLVVAVAGCGGGGGGTSDAPVADAPTTDAPTTDAPTADASIVDAAADAGTDAAIDGGLPAGAPPVGACHDGWCWVYPLPQGNALRGIWGASATDVWAVGLRGSAVHYDGATWTGYQLGKDLSFVWGAASDDVWAAGRTRVLHWNGTTWADSTTVGNALALGGTATDDVWVYDSTNTNLAHWTGSTWGTEALPAAGWVPIAFGGPTGTSVCVSKAGGIAKWLGNAWGIADAGTHAANAAAIIDDTHVVLAQNGGAIAEWNGTGWTTQTAPVAATWMAVAATSLDDVWVAGNHLGVPYRYHWNGATWSEAADAGDSGFAQALWIDPAGSPWEAMDDAEVAAWSGSAWTRKTVGDHYVMAVGGTAEDDIWTVSPVPVAVARNRVSHWDGAAWSDSTFPFDTTYTLGRIWASATDDVWIAAGHRVSGSQIDRVMIHWTGADWTASAALGTEDGILSPQGFTGVWGAAANDVYAVSRTALYHYGGSGWTQVAGVPGGTDVFGSGAGDVYVLNGTTVWHWNGAMWSSKTAPASVTRGWETSPTDIWLQDPGGGSGVHYDGSLFSEYQPTTGEGLPLGTTTDMYTFHYDIGDHMTAWAGGFSGTKTDTDAFFVPIGNSWVAPSGRVYAAGGPGLLVHTP